MVPTFRNAEIDVRKFIDYSMNPENPDNRGKWKAFVSIGYSLEDLRSRELAAWSVIKQLRQVLPNAVAQPGRSSSYGQRFEVTVEIVGPNGRQGSLFTAWQIDNGRDTPRLVTNWLKACQEGRESYESSNL